MITIVTKEDLDKVLARIGEIERRLSSTTNTPAKKRKPVTPYAVKVWAALQNGKAWTPDRLRKHTGASSGAVSGALTRYVRAGKVDRLKDGVYRLRVA